MNPSDYFKTLPAAFSSPKDLAEFRAQFASMSEDDPRFWMLYLVVCPSARAEEPLIRGIISRLFFRGKVTRGAESDRRRGLKLMELIDFYLDHPAKYDYLIDYLIDPSLDWAGVCSWVDVPWTSPEIEHTPF